MLNLAGPVLYPVAIAAIYLSHPAAINPPEKTTPPAPTFAPAQRSSAYPPIIAHSVQAIRPLSTPTIKKQYRYYPISGSTATELRNQMNQRGPFDPAEGRRYDARTNWDVHWSYHYTHHNQRCVIDGVKSHVNVMVTLPHWQRSESAPRSLIAEWQRYMTALQIHEDGHGENGIQAGQQIYQTLWSLPGYSSCEELKVAAAAAVKQTVRRYNQHDVAYDQQTQHGLTQGAAFPSSTFATAPQ